MGNTGNQIDRFRGWAVTVLYGALGLFALVMIVATLKMWPFIADHIILKVFTLTAETLAAVTCSRSCWRFMQVMKARVGIPRLHLMPIFYAVLMLVLAGRLFAPVG